MSRDWRLPEHRPEIFQRFYSFHLKYRTHPGLVYMYLPDIATVYDLDADGRAWLVWLNGNTQNPAMSQLLLEASGGDPSQWRKAVDFWDAHFTKMDWDTDRRHQKSKFGEATEKWAEGIDVSPATDWLMAASGGWDSVWKYALSQPYMGRLSAWSMTEYARILLGHAIPDAATLLLNDKSGSQSHRNGLGLLAGYDSTYWGPGDHHLLGVVEELESLGERLVRDARERNRGHPDVGYLTLESALCTHKSWYKPNRRYPNVYSDMAYERLLKAEARFGKRFENLWQSRADHLPNYLRLECSPNDPGLVAVKQNHFLETGQPIMMDHEWPDLGNDFNDNVRAGAYGVRKDKQWN